MRAQLALIFLALLCSAANCLKVSVYYESLCPDSQRFIKNQLTPTYIKLGDVFDVDFVPYGKAFQTQENGKWTFECQHGSRECYGNKQQACALNQNMGQRKNVDFINCVMSSSNPSSDEKVKECADSNGFTWKTIKECADGDQGSELLAKLGDRTHNVNPIITFVPTIILDDSYDSNVQNELLRNFLNVVCKRISPKPNGCQ